MGQLEPINHLQRVIIVSYLKPYSCVQINCFTGEYLINRITDIKKINLKYTWRLNHQLKSEYYKINSDFKIDCLWFDV